MGTTTSKNKKDKQTKYADIIKKNNLTKEKAKSMQKQFIVLSICFILIGLLTMTFIIGILLIILGIMFAYCAYVSGDIAKDFQHYAAALSRSGSASTRDSNDTQSDSKVEVHKVAGTSYRQNEIKLLGTQNPDYRLSTAQLAKKKLVDVSIYEYKFKKLKAQLEEEPTNEYDPNAIKVMISGRHVGYIKKGSCTHVKKLIKTNSIKSITAIISGGNYKYIFRCGDGNDSFDCDKTDDLFKIRIEIQT